MRQAQARLEECAQLSRQSGIQWYAAFPLCLLGYTALAEGNLARAAQLFKDSARTLMSVAHQIVDWWPLAVAGLADIAWQSGDRQRAARLCGGLDRLSSSIPPMIFARVPIYPSDRLEFGRIMQAMRAQLGEPAFAAAWAEGQAMTLDQAAEYALTGGSLEALGLKCG